jgi:Flp pilus assembly protein TadD
MIGVMVLAGCASSQKPAREPELKGNASPYEFHRSMAYTLLRTHQYARAIPSIQYLLKAKEKSAEPHYLMGRIHLGMGLWPQAEAALSRAVALDPTLAAAHALLGVLFDSRGDHAKAEAQHRESMRLDPRSASYRNNLGFSLYLQGRYPESVAIFRDALALDPTLSKIHNNLGWSYAKAGDLRLAHKHFNLAGDVSLANNNMGFAHEGRGELVHAYDYYLKAVQGDPDLRPAQTNLARVCKRLGRPVPQAAEPAGKTDTTTKEAAQ